MRAIRTQSRGERNENTRIQGRAGWRGNSAGRIQHLVNLPLEARLREIDGMRLRLEAAEQAGDLWFVDFAWIRHEGPGKASATAPIEDFDLADEEGSGHETAACYNSQTGFISLQYNHYGPRVTRIQTYLTRFAAVVAGVNEDDNLELALSQEGFGFTPVLRTEAEDALDGMGIIKSVDMAFHVPGILAGDGRQKQSLSSLLDNPLIGHAEKLRIHISAARPRASSLALNDVKQAVTDLLGFRDDVSELQVTVKENEEAPSEPIDFLSARLEADIPVARVGRRYGREQRWAALRQALNTGRLITNSPNAQNYFLLG